MQKTICSHVALAIPGPPSYFPGPTNRDKALRILGEDQDQGSSFNAGPKALEFRIVAQSR